LGIEILDVFLKGVGIGLAIAAPVGPIGLLCIRSTLTDGRAAGLASGLGAATADAVYGFMVATGIAATGLLVAYAGPMVLVGGLFIIGLGAMSIKSFLRSRPPSGDADTKSEVRSGGVLGAFATSFVLTISNPMTILAFVGLVAALGASASSHPSAPYLLVLGVFAGSALWWLVLVNAAATAKSRLTPSATRWLDLISGLALVSWGAWIAVGAVS
jgi:threonine/homoserine/homoserine lactone efflux protein